MQSGQPNSSRIARRWLAPEYIVHDLYGAIGDAYWASGGPGGPFGAPISDEYPDGLGRSSDFEHGTIHWSGADGILEILAPPVPPAAGDFSGRGQREARQAYTIIQLVERYGYPINGAAGLVGNLTKESYVVPACIEGAPESGPLHAKDHAGVARDFSPVEVMTRVQHVSGPQLPGAGLAQWTSEPRRGLLFTHAYRGTVYGADNLRSIDLQIDYLVWELGGNPYASHVDAVLRRADVTLEDASDAVLLHFEIPGGAASQIGARRTAGREALAAFRAMTGTS